MQKKMKEVQADKEDEENVRLPALHVNSSTACLNVPVPCTGGTLHESHSMCFDVDDDEDELASGHDISFIYDSCWSSLPCAAPTAPKAKEEGLHACLHDVDVRFTPVWECLAVLDEMLGELACNCADCVPELVPPRNLTHIPETLATQVMILSLAELIPESSSDNGYREIICECEWHLIERVVSKRDSFRNGMKDFISFMFGGFDLADSLRDDVPVFLDGNFFDGSLQVAFELLSEFNTFQRPCLSLDLFELCDG